MRLLDTGLAKSGDTRLELHEFFGEQVPPYAILSHTWDKEEVLFDDVHSSTQTGKEGYRKAQSAINQARKDGYEWLWVDTCCINKNSSAELMEAINSMYSYYQKAERCYAYLKDIPHRHNENCSHCSKKLCPLEVPLTESLWFTRGWCLQELLAPQKLEFFSAEWEPLGNKTKWMDPIALKTRIDREFLTGGISVLMASVSKRMSWAASRHCTREEDKAYSLMGLFDVNMPMLYGEGGRRAFLRLQEEIMKRSDDHSLFAWTDPSSSQSTHGHGLLADSPAAFINSADYAANEYGKDRRPFSTTNMGLRITLCISPLGDSLFVAALECPVPSEDVGKLAIYLKRLPTGDDQYTRVDCAKLYKTYDRGFVAQVFVLDDIELAPQKLDHFIQLGRNDAAIDDYELVDVRSPKLSESERQCLPRSASPAREWVPSHMSTTYKLFEKPDLSIILLFRRKADDKHFTLLLGAFSRNLELGFQYHEISGSIEDLISQYVDGTGRINYRLKDTSPSAKLLLDLRTLETPSQRIRLDVQTSATAVRKTHYVTIHIDDKPEKTRTEQIRSRARDICLGNKYLRRHRVLFGLGRD